MISDLTSKVNSPVVFGYGAFGVGWDLKAPLTFGLLVRYDQGFTTLSKEDYFQDEFGLMDKTNGATFGMPCLA